MLVYSLAVTLLTLFYIFILLRFIAGWRSLPVWDTLKKTVTTKVSVVVPARNEEENIQACIEAILAQNYPSNLLEIIIVDDHSTDQTPQIIKKYSHQNVQLLSLADHIKEGSTQSFKKKAIEVAIQQSTGELIVTTDADCTMGNNWLRYLVSYYEIQQPKFIAAPVVFQGEENNFQRFQSLDFAGMMGVTGAGIHKKFLHMCNGANLAYPKSAFYEVDGFEGVDHLASGDDMLLQQKIARRFPGQIGYIKQPDAVTITTAKPTLSSFLNQRLRWATKTTSYQEWKVTAIWAMVWLFSVSIPISLVLAIWWPWLLWVFGFQLMAKVIIDYFFLRMMVLFFKRPDLIRFPVYFISIFWELFYVIFIGTVANFKKEYDWKGRKVN